MLKKQWHDGNWVCERDATYDAFILMLTGAKSVRMQDTRFMKENRKNKKISIVYRGSNAQQGCNFCVTSSLYFDIFDRNFIAGQKCTTLH